MATKIDARLFSCQSRSANVHRAYDGDHRQKLPQRLRTHILPFFAAALY
jgi:hypothetical protein